MCPSMSCCIILWILKVEFFTSYSFLDIGVQGIQVEELWSLDQESFDQLKYVRTKYTVPGLFN